MNRRQLLQMSGLFAAGGALPPLAAWAQESPPLAPRVFDARAHGAKGDGKTLDTQAINGAIDACHQAGGGVAYLAPGTYLSGTVVLKSNVTLYLEAGSVLLGSADLSDYKLQPGPKALGDANQKHLIFARDAENIGLAGPGKIDGQGPKFWTLSGRAVPKPEEAWRDVATYDWKPLDRASPMLEFYNCKNVGIENVRIENAPGWTLRPILCNKVLIRGVTIKNPVIGPNTDGLDLTCSQNVFVSDCMIDTGDDAICLKSENPYSPEVPVSRNITITNCILTCCCNGFKFGTASRGGFENVTFSNSIIFNDDVALAGRVIAGLALEIVDGGWMEGILISNIRMQRVRTPIFIRRALRRARPDGSPGTLRGVMIHNVQATGSICTSSITGQPGFDVEDVTLSNIRIESDETGKAEWAGRGIAELPHDYPEARMFGRLPAAGLYCRHVRGLRAQDLDFKFSPNEERPALVLDDVRDVRLDGFRGSSIAGTLPVIRLIQAKEVVLRGCMAPPATTTFLDVRGDQSEHIALMSSDLGFADRVVRQDPNVPPGAVALSGNLRKPRAMR